MNGKKAKKIRKKVYGDFSIKLKEYETTTKGKYLKVDTIKATGLRRVYKDAKKRYKQGEE